MVIIKWHTHTHTHTYIYIYIYKRYYKIRCEINKFPDFFVQAFKLL